MIMFLCGGCKTPSATFAEVTESSGTVTVPTKLVAVNAPDDELKVRYDNLCNPNEVGMDYIDVCEYLEYDPDQVIDDLKKEIQRLKLIITEKNQQ